MGDPAKWADPSRRVCNAIVQTDETAIGSVCLNEHSAVSVPALLKRLRDVNVGYSRKLPIRDGFEPLLRIREDVRPHLAICDHRHSGHRSIDT